ncbi:xylulokinase, partial [Patescibacteria group bacterium]|nr:xylulokinase [Patescibacteria group bacterium]
MALYLGLDLGTSVLKATIINEEGKIIGASAKEIHIHSPKSGWAEESPAAWWETFQDLIRGLKNAAPLKQIKAVGLSGQMHGIVCYDKNLKPMRPAIIWPDKRSTTQVEKILKKLPSSKIYAITGNPIFTGFMLPSLLWLKENENKLYKSLERVSSPKDFIALKLTDNLSCEPSDALATGCFNYIKNTWSDKIIKSMGLNKDLFPKIIPTSKPYGTITAATSKSTGLPAGIPVFGGSDQSMAAMGSGLISEGSSLLAISTGGQFLAVTKKTIIDPKGRLHTLKHAID